MSVVLLLHSSKVNGRELLSEAIIKNLPALDFDTADIPAFIMTLVSDCDAVSDLYDYVDYAYDELAGKNKEGWKERFEAIDNIDAILDASLEASTVEPLY